MKKFLTCVALFFAFSQQLKAQNIGINTNGASPHPSAILDVDVSAILGSKRGLLIPRVTTADRNAIVSPAVGLLIYNLDTKCINAFDGTSWTELCPKVSTCSTGFISVNGNFSIEQYQHPDASFFNAILFCDSLGARLCTWQEWFLACSKGNLFGATGDWEWVDDSIHGNNALTVGSSWCDDSNGLYVHSTAGFRCCCDK